MVTQTNSGWVINNWGTNVTPFPTETSNGEMESHNGLYYIKFTVERGDTPLRFQLDAIGNYNRFVGYKLNNHKEGDILNEHFRTAQESVQSIVGSFVNTSSSNNNKIYVDMNFNPLSGNEINSAEIILYFRNYGNPNVGDGMDYKIIDSTGSALIYRQDLGTYSNQTPVKYIDVPAMPYTIYGNKLPMTVIRDAGGNGWIDNTDLEVVYAGRLNSGDSVYTDPAVRASRRAIGLWSLEPDPIDGRIYTRQKIESIYLKPKNNYGLTIFSKNWRYNQEYYPYGLFEGKTQVNDDLTGGFHWFELYNTGNGSDDQNYWHNDYEEIRVGYAGTYDGTWKIFNEAGSIVRNDVPMTMTLYYEGGSTNVPATSPSSDIYIKERNGTEANPTTKYTGTNQSLHNTVNMDGFNWSTWSNNYYFKSFGQTSAQNPNGFSWNNSLNRWEKEIVLTPKGNATSTNIRQWYEIYSIGDIYNVDNTNNFRDVSPNRNVNIVRSETYGTINKIYYRIDDNDPWTLIPSTQFQIEVPAYSEIDFTVKFIPNGSTWASISMYDDGNLVNPFVVTMISGSYQWVQLYNFNMSNVNGFTEARITI